jgi:hypothetical protein
VVAAIGKRDREIARLKEALAKAEAAKASAAIISKRDHHAQ